MRLFVRALKSIEYAEVFEQEHEVKQVMTSRVTAGLIATSVVTTRGRAFNSSTEVLGLSDGEVSQFGLEVLRALHAISPTYHHSNVEAWRMALKEGAQHGSNITEALTMYRSCDRVGMNGVAWERPDRYFGLPMCELTDGQLLVYSASVELIGSMLKSDNE